jgi:hypothetical protein
MCEFILPDYRCKCPRERAVCVCVYFAPGAVAVRRFVRAARCAHLAPAQRLDLSVDRPTSGGGGTSGRSRRRARGTGQIQGLFG